MYIPKLRRVSGAVKEIKSADHRSEVSAYFIVHLIKTGEISTRKFGHSWLVDLNELYCFFQAKEAE